VENVIVSEEKHKPVLDEQTLAKLLEAAYVLQEHNREVRDLELGLDLRRDQLEAEEKAKTKQTDAVKPHGPEPAGHGDYTFTLAQIVATQHQIQIRNLELEKTMALVVERVIDIAGASGAAIGMVEGKKVRYRAVAGSKALPLGTEVPTEKALCLPCIRSAQVFRCADVDPEFLIDTQECRRRGIQSLIAVPIFHEGGVTGGLELYYPNQNGFTDQDIHTCQLMAGLVTEALARDEEITWKQSLANERAVMLEALEKLKPNLSALIETEPVKEIVKPAHIPESVPAAYVCAKCGQCLMSGEQFCGQCGTPRGAQTQSKNVPAWPGHEINETHPATALPKLTIGHTEFREAQPVQSEEESLPESLDEEFPDLFASPLAVSHKLSPPAEASELHVLPAEEPVAETQEEIEQSSGLESASVEEEKTDEENTALVRVEQPADWSSAASAREFLEQVAGVKERSGLARFWDTRRGDIYLAVAVLLVAGVVRWGIWSNHQVSATNAPPSAVSTHRKAAPAPAADLSLFDRMLISLGLADAPEAPEDKGNPSAQVWVDLRTALYYCPGMDLYGKTPKGKYTTQREAQLDQFEPAYRKACE
jgi:hypothetical protein